ncbi:MAG: outer membrane lipoprotein LolB [Burkholderiaceae bacterium]|nr:MAG: outer membrane lipoprotein LolB [Burkholderiaceae bacterium]
MRTLVLSLLLLLAACATTPGGDIANNITHDHFSVSGRFTVNYQKPDGSDDSASGGFDWRQEGKRTQIDLRTPLGQTIAQITVGDNGAAQLQVPDRPVANAPSVELLTERQLGWRLPVRGLRDWLVRKSENGEPQQMTEDGWQIDYLGWSGTLPRRLNLRWLAASPKLEIKLVLDQWE